MFFVFCLLVAAPSETFGRLCAHELALWRHCREDKQEDSDLHRYRDRAKERREDQNPDYSHTVAELGSLHAVAPPGSVSLRWVDGAADFERQFL